MTFNESEHQSASTAFRLSKSIIDNNQITRLNLHLVENGAKLISLWGDTGQATDKYSLNMVFDINSELVAFTLLLDADNPQYPDFSRLFPCANRQQRATFDLLGFQAMQAKDERPWLSHHQWNTVFPLLKNSKLQSTQDASASHNYHFKKIAGESVHEIPVGPVHAGVIESGHFRFQVVGEKVLRLEERLGYKHKGIEKRFEGLSFFEATKLAGRISGDSTVAFSWAYSMAIEEVAKVQAPTRSLWLRALLLERERIMNHLGDLGAIINDTGFGFGLAHFSRLKEEMLRTNEQLFNHRYLMDIIKPGGVTSDLTDDHLKLIQKEITTLKDEVHELKKIIDQHGGVQDRLNGTGNLTRIQAEELEIFGVCARASGIHCDQRKHNPCFPYTQMKVIEIIKKQGDVWARCEVRFQEIFESLRLLNYIIHELKASQGPIAVQIKDIPANQEGYGWIEGFRGPVFIALKTGQDNFLSRVHPHDPSWASWPAIEVAVLGNIVPDFPLINKSFNLSYAGQDL